VLSHRLRSPAFGRARCILAASALLSTPFCYLLQKTTKMALQFVTCESKGANGAQEHHPRISTMRPVSIERLIWLKSVDNLVDHNHSIGWSQ